MSYRTANLQMLYFTYYSTNIRIEYFKHAAHSPFFSLKNAVYFIMLTFFGSCVIHILYTECDKIKKKIRRQRVKQNCAPSWIYLQDYTGMHSQQNIKLGCWMSDVLLFLWLSKSHPFWIASLFLRSGYTWFLQPVLKTEDMYGQFSTKCLLHLRIPHREIHSQPKHHRELTYFRLNNSKTSQPTKLCREH